MPPTTKNLPRLLAVPVLCTLASHAFALSINLTTGGTVNLGNRTYTSITVTNGTAINNTGTPITATLAFGGSTDNWTGTLDLQANKMIIQPATSKATALSNLQNQTAFGTTHTTGILSTALPADMGIAILDNAVTNFSTFGGEPVNTNSLLLSRELLGDANADGNVDLTDVSIVLDNFGSATPNWTSGNFDFSPTIDLTDLSDVLDNFGVSNPNSAMLTGSALAAPAPEPASLSAILFSTAVLHLGRRRRV